MILYRVAGYGFGIAVVCRELPGFTFSESFIILFSVFSRADETIHILRTETLRSPSAMFLKEDRLKIDYSKYFCEHIFANF